MEKIYMEENHRQTKKKRGLDASVVLSFVVAIFAVCSLALYGVASNQNTGVSYAAPTGDSIVFSLDESESVTVSESADPSNNWRITVFYSEPDFTNPIFCIEANDDVVSTKNGTDYYKGEAIDDYGLLYILNNSYVNGKSIYDSANPNKYVESWATQVAIWLYLYEADPSSVHYLKPEYVEGYKTMDRIDYCSDITDPTSCEYAAIPGIGNKIDELVAAAKNASNAKKLDVNISSDKIVKTKDEKYYQSDKISVVGNPSSSLKNFTVALSGVDGAIAVDSNGNKLTGEVAPGTDFYVIVPVDKVTEKVSKVKVSVTGTFDSLAGNVYSTTEVSAGGKPYQKVVSVTGTTVNENKGIEVEFVGAPDTGMNTAQTIYFIGLIILLCGVGIVYANAKPVESK